MSKIKDLLDQRYGLRTPRLHATVTAAPLVGGRSAGYVIATVGGVGGVRVNVSPDLRAPFAVGDTLVVDGVGTPAATEYWADGRIAGARADSDIYQFPSGGTVTIGGASTTLGAGDIVLGSTLTDMSNWWYQYELGRWQIRKGTLMHGAIGDLNGLYGYSATEYGTAFGQYSAGQVNITTDPTNGFRIRAHTTPVFQADTNGVVWALSSLRAGTGNDTVGITATDGTWRLYAGHATPASAPFRVDKAGALTATGATITGALTATSGAIGGWSINATSLYTGTEDHSGYTANAGDLTIYSNGTDASVHAKNFYIDASGILNASGATITGTVASDNFVSGTAGWQINNTGTAEFANITARGAIKTAVFEKSLTLAFAGSQITSKSASVVAADVTLSGTTFTLVVRQQAGAAPFANGDLVYLKTETLATYATVDTGAASGANWSYTATYQSGSNSGTIAIGQTAIDYGGNGDGRVIVTADGTNAPYLSIASHDMTAVPVWTERARLGLLTGISGASGYGLWTDNGFFTGAITANSGSLAGFLTVGASGGIYQGTGTAGTPTTGLKVWNDSGVGRIAGYNATALQWGADTDGKLYAGAGAVMLDVDGITLASATTGGAGALKTKSSTKLIGEYYTGRDGNDDVTGGVDLFNYDATSNVSSSFGVYHSAGLSSRYVSASTPTTSVNTIIGSKLVLNIRAATGTVVSLQDNFTNEYWALTNAGTMIGPAWKPATNSTTALQMQKANGTAVVTVDTTNSELVVTGGVEVSGGVSQKGIYNVLNYGAVGNGVTDDTDAIQAALDAIDAAGGGTLFFPDGTYAVDGAQNTAAVYASSGLQNCGFLLPAHCKVELSHNAVLLVTSLGTFCSALVADNVDDIEITGGTIRGPWEDHWTACSDWTRVSDTSFTVAGNQAATYPELTKLRWKQGGEWRYGVVNTATYTSSTLITLKYGNVIASSPAITDEYYGGVTEWGYGIWLLGATNVHIHDITIEYCWGDGIMVQEHTIDTGPTPDTVFGGSDITIEGVTSQYNLRNNLSLLAGENIKITRCSFNYAGGTSPQAGIDVEPENNNLTLSDIAITDCSFIGNNGMGLTFQLGVGTTKNVVLSGNTIRDSGYYGILVGRFGTATATDFVISGNTVSDLDGGANWRDSSGAGIYLAVDRAIVSNNTITNTNCYGIMVYNCDSVHIVNNSIDSVGNYALYGSVFDAVLAAAGTGYHADDVLTLVQTGASGCTFSVDSVDGSGHITAITLLTGGTGYVAASGLATTVAPSGGSNATVSITAHAGITLLTSSYNCLVHGNRIRAGSDNTYQPAYGIDVSGGSSGNVITGNDLVDSGEIANTHYLYGTLPLYYLNLGSTSDVMYISTDGNNYVGFGTSAPDAQFEFKRNFVGAASVCATNTTNSTDAFPEFLLRNAYGSVSGLRINSGDGGQAGYGSYIDTVLYNNYNSASYGDIVFATHNGTAVGERMKIKATGALEIPEMSAPTGVANKATIYARTNGSKTLLCCKLGDNTEIVLATQA